jgi:L-fuculose-phosphate aldolase
MHLAIYKTRPDIVAIVHAHPIFATAFAAAGIPLDKNVLTEVVMAIGKIPLTRYGTPGTEEIAEVVNEKIIDNDAVLLANHGVVTVGKDVFDAYYKMERVEHYANIIFVARLLGGEKELSKEDIKKICKNCD